MYSIQNTIKVLNLICSDKIHQGGAVAAPVGGQVLSEVLPYLELQKDKKDEEIIEEIQVPEIREMKVQEAKKVLKEIGLELEISTQIEENTNFQECYIKEQIPKPGIKINKGSKVSIEI